MESQSCKRSGPSLGCNLGEMVMDKVGGMRGTEKQID